MMKSIRFYTIAVLFAKLQIKGKANPKGNRCLHVDMRFSTFDIGSHVISCLREFVIRAEHCELHNNNGGRTTSLSVFWRLKFKQILKIMKISVRYIIKQMHEWAGSTHLRMRISKPGLVCNL